jgi:hypothetical protein
MKSLAQVFMSGRRLRIKTYLSERFDGRFFAASTGFAPRAERLAVAGQPPAPFGSMERFEQPGRPAATNSGKYLLHDYNVLKLTPSCRKVTLAT